MLYCIVIYGLIIRILLDQLSLNLGFPIWPLCGSASSGSSRTVVVVVVVVVVVGGGGGAAAATAVVVVVVVVVVVGPLPLGEGYQVKPTVKISA